MATNSAPIYSGQGDIQGGDLLIAAAADYTGLSYLNVPVFIANATNGGYIQRLRFKATGPTTAATVARIYINNGSSSLASTATAVAGTPTGTAGTAGTMGTGPYFAKIVSVDAFGGCTAASTETASVSVTGPTGSVAWAWTAGTNAASYRIYVGSTTGNQTSYFTSTTNSYTQTAQWGTRDSLSTTITNANNFFYGELSLPLVTVSTTAATVDIDYPMNFALPPGYRVLVGLGAATTTNGWQVTGIGGNYTAIA